MNNRLPLLVLRLALASVLLLTVDGCKVYDRIFRPHHITDPPMSPELKARLKEQAEAKKRGLTPKTTTPGTAEEGTTVDATTPDPAPSEATSGEANKLPEHGNVKYDRHELMKKPKLKHRRYKK